MKKLLLTLIVSFFLVGCPGGRYVNYKSVKSFTKKDEYYLIPFNNFILKVRVLYYISFINNNEMGLLSMVDIDDSNLLPNNIIVTSNKIGVLKYKKTNGSSFFYSKKMSDKRVNKNIRFIKNDTVKILIKKGGIIKQFEFYYNKD